MRGEGRELGEELADWLAGDGDKTLGSLVDVFEERSFAVLFVLLLGVSALPLPTGGATHVFEIIAVLVALQLVAGREEIWLPQRWRRIEHFDHRSSNVVFGVLVIGGSAAAFLAPPFTGLDTLPSLGVLLLSLSVLLKDALLALLALLVGAAGVTLEVVLGAAAIRGIWGLF